MRARVRRRHLPKDGTLICRDCRDDQQAGLRPQSAASSFQPMRPSTLHLHCESCERVFAAGHLPTDGVLICRDCRDEQAEAGLFEIR